MICRYGITKMAEMNGELGIECENPATRNVTSLDPEVTASGITAIDLCELHYEIYLALKDEV
jgi:hypothetical protein